MRRTAMEHSEIAAKLVRRSRRLLAALGGSSWQGVVDGAANEMGVWAVHFDYKEAGLEMQEGVFGDWPLEDDIRTVLWLVKRMVKDGLTPIQLLDACFARHPYADCDRSRHELRVIAKVLKLAAAYYQENLFSLANFGLLARRWSLLMDAHAEDSMVAHYEGSELFMGVGRGLVGVAPALTRAVARGLKDEADSKSARHRARELRTNNPRRQQEEGKKGDPKKEDPSAAGAADDA